MRLFNWMFLIQSHFLFTVLYNCEEEVVVCTADTDSLPASLTEEEEESGLEDEAESGGACHVSVEGAQLGRVVHEGAPDLEEHLHAVDEEEHHHQQRQWRETRLRDPHPVLLPCTHTHTQVYNLYKTGTSQFGAISKAQKAQNIFFWKKTWNFLSENVAQCRKM